MTNTGTLNYQWAFSLIHHLALHGVSQAVISPGSRSTPLALACEKHPDITTWVQVDERSAGFFALGLAQAQNNPVILICTSGSAIANWFPAVVEASHSYIPLLLLSADRPAELQNCGANQTIDQNSLFGSHVRDFINLEHADEAFLTNNYLKRIATRAFSKALNRKPGPVHINIPIREPLLPRRFTATELNRFIERLSEQVIESASSVIQSDVSDPSVGQSALQSLCHTLEKGNTLIVCGRLAYEEQQNFPELLVQLAEQLNCPILLDPLSNLRAGSISSAHFIVNYDLFLKHHSHPAKDDHDAFLPNCILRFGQFPTSKSLMNFLKQLDAETVLVSPYGDWLDPIHKASTLLHTSPARLCRQLLGSALKPNTQSWLVNWQAAEKQAENRISQALNCNALYEGQVVDSLLNAIPQHSLLFSGNSMAIRDLDTFMTQSSVQEKNLTLYGNRGASGIDGNLSTFFGLLASQNRQSEIKHYGVALIGDLSFYHDMNGLLIAKKLAAQGYNACIILINNSGGGIFNYLPQHELDEFEKLWITDTELDFQYSARLYSLAYHRIESKDVLYSELTSIMAQSGIQLVEIIIDQKTSVECHKSIHSL